MSTLISEFLHNIRILAEINIKVNSEQHKQQINVDQKLPINQLLKA
jgi:hypothetical protein